MKGKIIGAGASVGATGGVFGAGYAAHRLGFIPAEVWFYLWPSLVAAVLLAATVVLLLMGARRWVWPFAVGFVVQTAGVLMLIPKWIDSPWQALMWTLVAMAAVLLILGIVSLIVYLRARAIERQLLSPAGGGLEGIDPGELEEIRQKMQEALGLLRRAGHGRNAIYQLPWFLVIGRPAAGKTVAIKKSGLSLPVRRDWTKGDGGNHTCEWFFTNEMIFLDTPGAWVLTGASEDAQVYWKELLRRIRRSRGRRPLDGLIVVVPADDLLSRGGGELEEQAANIREIIDLLHDELKFRFPIYLLVSKTDLVEGFTDFFHGLPAQRRHEILGWSSVEPSRGRPESWIEKGFEEILGGLETYRLEMLARGASTTRNRRLFYFPEEFRRLAQPLVRFAEVLFHEDPSTEAPVFRGFYFTSGTQEGAPLGSAMTELARTLGVPSRLEQTEEGEESKPRSFFLLELFRDLMVGDEGLVGRTAVHWWKQRRNTFFASFLPAGVGLVLLTLALVAYVRNGRLYDRIAEQAPARVAELTSIQSPPTGSDAVRALEITDQFRRDHRALTGFAPFRGFGMRRPGRLASETFDLFRREFVNEVLEPTLRQAESYAEREDANTCARRLEVLQSVIWLRMGERRDWTGRALSGFDRVWQLDGSTAEHARELLRRQFEYLHDHVDPSEQGTLLPGFSIREVARDISSDCGAEGATSSLKMFSDFQSQCLDPGSPALIEDCVRKLNAALNRDQQEILAFIDGYNTMKQNLDTLRAVEPEAATALSQLGNMDVRQDSGECLQQFTDSIRPDLKSYLDRNQALAKQCRDVIDRVPSRAEKWPKLQEELKLHETELKPLEESLGQKVKDYNLRCSNAVQGFTGIDLGAFERTAENYRRNYCLEVEAKPVPAAPRPVVRRAAPAPRVRALTYLLRPGTPGGELSPSAWDAQIDAWRAQLAAVEATASSSQRQYEEDQVSREASSYAKRYASAWMRYLDGIKLRDRELVVPAWLDALASSGEWADVLDPAVRAASVAGSSAQGPFADMGLELHDLGEVEAFRQQKLGEYQEKLRAVARDLDQCDKNLQFFQTYRRGVESRDPANSLVTAVDWVEKNAGQALARGSLRDVLLKPLDEARSYALSGDRIGVYWEEIRERYAKIANRFPFVGGGKLDAEPVDFEALKALLGGKSGLVVRLSGLAQGATVDPAARQWLADAGKYSKILFEDGEDTPRAVPFTLALGAEVFDPADVGKKFQLTKVTLLLDLEQGYEWKTEDGDLKKKQRVKMNLIGDSASKFSVVQANLKVKKGLFRVPWGDAFKEAEPFMGPSAEDAWAPLKLFAKGLRGGLAAYDGGPLKMEYRIPISRKGEQVGQLVLPFEIDDDDVRALITLVKSGLPRPPAQVR